MKIAVIGASGFLGKKLMDYFSKESLIVGTYSKNMMENMEHLDAADKNMVEDFLVKHKPDVVIDTAALTSSVACEKNPEICEKMNYLTAKNIAEACRKINAKMIFISSSYVFDGKKGDYSEEEKPSHTNEYARTKIMAEKEVSKLNNHLIIRIEIIYGSIKGKIRFGNQIFGTEFVEVGYPEQTRNPLFVDDLPGIVDFLIRKNWKGIFHIGGPEKIKMIDFLRELSKLENSEDKIKVVDSSKLLVKPPKNPTLNISKINNLGIKTTSFED